MRVIKMNYTICDLEENSIFLLAVVRDENILLEYFIEYYKKIGITHFIIIDNGSKDGSFEYLRNLDENIILLQTFDHYKEHFGTNWINYALKKYCLNKWCLVVDIDELIYLDDINTLINKMISNNSKACCFLLLDMYSNLCENYKKGKEFGNHSKYFDKFSNYYNYNKEDKTVNGRWKTHFFLNRPICGGVRNRLIGVNCWIIKRSLFYNDPQTYVGWGYHTITGVSRVHPRLEYLLHYKFIKPNFKEFIQKRINNNQDWNNSSEYKQYIDINPKYIYDKNLSIKLKNKKQLDEIFSEIIF